MKTESQIEELNLRVAKATAHTAALAALAAAATASARAACDAYAVAYDAAIAVQTSLLLAQRKPPTGHAADLGQHLESSLSRFPVRVAAATAAADSAYAAAVAAATAAYDAFAAATDARAAARTELI